MARGERAGAGAHHRKAPPEQFLDEAEVRGVPAEEGPGLHDRITSAYTAAGFASSVAQRVVQMETIVGLVAAGLGVALVPALFKAVG